MGCVISLPPACDARKKEANACANKQRLNRMLADHVFQVVADIVGARILQIASTLLHRIGCASGNASGLTFRAALTHLVRGVFHPLASAGHGRVRFRVRLRASVPGSGFCLIDFAATLFLRSV
jgi:hypothetical protein